MPISKTPKAALMRTMKPVSNDSPISRWPYSTRKVVTGAIARVVNTTKTSWNVLVWLRKPTTLKLGTKDLMRGRIEKRPRHQKTKIENDAFLDRCIRHGMLPLGFENFARRRKHRAARQGRH